MTLGDALLRVRNAARDKRPAERPDGGSSDVAMRMAAPVAWNGPARAMIAVALTISLKISVIVAIVELFSLTVYTFVLHEPVSVLGELLDVVMTIAISTPLILFWVIRPYIAARDAAELGLAAANAALHEEVAHRSRVEEELREHERNLELQVEEIGFMKELMEKQAADAVGLAEDLSVQKVALEESRSRSEYLAHHDMLTGLPNRRAFERTLTQLTAEALEQRGTLTLIFVDLDNFKTVNDTLGHDRGDALLAQVAEKLRNTTCDADFVARLGGDEFAVLSTRFGQGGDADLGHFVEHIRQALSIPVGSGEHTIPVSATLGVAAYPDDAPDRQRLLRSADRAMYAAKERGRNCAVFYNPIVTPTENAAR